MGVCLFFIKECVPLKNDTRKSVYLDEYEKE